MEEYLDNYPAVLTVDQVADLLMVSPPTIRKLIKENKIVAIHVGRRIRIPKNRLIDYIELSN